ncbi:hypothetical protein [Cryobacterium sp. BB736]|uniref:hypothetical protein n=1 Tax=Cryobacterium sp. BB736 TaxID=2746963 RepID=UPI001874FF11|nr:hypothetical protein [Cryobacterium sp. BB736]
MPYEPHIPEGQHLGKSRSEEEAVVGHLFDDETNELKGHATWRWVDEPEEYSTHRPEYEEPARPLTPEEIEALVEFVGLVILGIIKVVEVTAPVVKRVWVGKIAPRVKSAFERVKSVRKRQSPQIAVPETTMFVATSQGLVETVTQSKIRMSRGEWEQRLRAMVAAEEFRDEQARLLANALITDSAGAVGEAQSGEVLEPREFAARLTATLEARPELITPEAMSEVLRVVLPKELPQGTPEAQALEQ